MFTWISLAVAAALVGLDQLVKLWAITVLSQTDTIPLIPGVLHLSYQQNFGAAFSILQGKTSFLVIFTSLMLAVILFLLLTKRIDGKLPIASLSLILAGGVGNLLDRIVREGGFVVDYIDFRLINFPVFNVADICVVCGTGLLMLHLILSERKNQMQNKSEKP